MIADWMYALFEQAFKRQEAESKITHEMIPLAEHLIKMLKWEDSRNNKKHMKNILRSWEKEYLTIQFPLHLSLRRINYIELYAKNLLEDLTTQYIV